MRIPGRLQELASFPGAADWLARLPRLVAECAEQWSLRLGEPFPYANVSLAAAATLPDGTEAVLKVAFPHWESEHEADALEHWGGRGAVRLLGRDRGRNAMLLERATPGTSLLELPEEEGYAAAAEVARALGGRRAPDDHPFGSFEATTARWARELPRRWEEAGRPFERELLDAAVTALRELPSTQGERAVVSQDLHRGNILAAQREPWLAIDPKPVVAERAVGTVALLRDGPGRVEWRLHYLAEALGLDLERMRGWGIAHTIAWGFAEHEPRVHRSHVEAARRLLRA
jgi:streptomycin 6-kinase